MEEDSAEEGGFGVRRKGRKAVRLFLSSVWFISLFLYKKEGGGGDTLRIFVM